MDIEEAVKQAITEAPARKFSESVDLAINLHNIDLALPGNRVDAEVILPHGLGKPTKIAVFAAGETGLRAKSAGADRVISADEIKELAGNKRAVRKLADEYKFFIAETQFMPDTGRNPTDTEAQEHDQDQVSGQADLSPDCWEPKYEYQRAGRKH